MRSIKFRAWNNELNKYVYDIQNCYDDMNGQSFGGIIQNVKLGLSYSAIEQFTGLYDKNNKPIYEGDILKWKIPCFMAGAECYDGSIIPDFTEGCGEIRYKEYAFYCFDKDGQQNILGCDPSRNIEIIGNIHQDKDLLNGEETKE